MGMDFKFDFCDICSLDYGNIIYGCPCQGHGMMELTFLHENNAVYLRLYMYWEGGLRSPYHLGTHLPQH